jgi:hypothetical protein
VWEQSSIKNALDAREHPHFYVQIPLDGIFERSDFSIIMNYYNHGCFRSNAQKLLELYLKDGIILGVHKVDQVKDEKDVFYRLNKQLTDKYTFRPRRSVSVDDNRKRFTQPRFVNSHNITI